MSKKAATGAGTATPKSPEAKAPTGAPTSGGGGHVNATVSAPKGKQASGPLVPGGCCATGCKVQAKRFNFCAEHYEHFKFGLIKKTGEQVSDYEKKIEHFLAYQRGLGQSQRKAA